MASTSSDLSPPPPHPTKPKASPLDFRNNELVSRLLAANPPYLYNTLPPTTFFFSELLRSFVQHHNEATAAAAAAAAASQRPSRSARKRSWTATKPAEVARSEPDKGEHQRFVEGLMLPPPPPPIWYPPLYPTYGLDPLNFLLDSTSKNSTEVVFKRPRNESAFSVPVRPAAKRFDVKSLGIDRRTNKTGVNYVMKSLGTIYSGMNIAGEESKSEEESEEEKQKKELKDLQELIGLELVVDYMNHSKSGRLMLSSELNSLSSDRDSPTLEVVAINDTIPTDLTV